MPRWGMVIDLKKCTGCGTCLVGCNAENYVPTNVLWNKIYDYETGTFPNVSRHFLTVPCMHCKDPVCVDVCPTGATTQREDGIVLINYEKCVGCCYCLVSCPYQARSIQREEVSYYDQPTVLEAFPNKYRSVHKRHEVGVVSKCTFCADRIDEGLKKGLMPGVDHEATPMCVVVCPVGARYFGDIDDPESEVSRLIATRRGDQLRPEHGTNPCVFYLHE